jgi:hypothetical protein
METIIFDVPCMIQLGIIEPSENFSLIYPESQPLNSAIKVILIYSLIYL